MSRVRFRPEERREQLIDVATHLFAERGLDGTAVSDIVAQAGVSQGTFYWYFDSKEALVSAVVESLSERSVVDVLRVADGEDPALDKLLAMRDSLLAATRSDRAVLAFLHRPGNEAFHDRVSRDAVKRTVPAFERVIEQGVREGVFRLTHTDDAARFIAALMDVTDPFDVFREPERIDHHVEALTEYALRGLGCDEYVVADALARGHGLR